MSYDCLGELRVQVKSSDASVWRKRCGWTLMHHSVLMKLNRKRRLCFVAGVSQLRHKNAHSTGFFPLKPIWFSHTGASPS